MPPEADVRTTITHSLPASLAVRLRQAVPPGERSGLICKLLLEELDRREGDVPRRELPAGES